MSSSSFGLTWGRMRLKIVLINGVQDVGHVAFLPDKSAGVFLLVQAVEEKAGADRAFLLSPLHEGDVAPGLLAARLHAVLVPIQLRRRNERRSLFHGLVAIEDEVLLTFLELGEAILARSGVQEQEQDREQERGRSQLSFKG